MRCCQLLVIDDIIVSRQALHTSVPTFSDLLLPLCSNARSIVDLSGSTGRTRAQPSHTYRSRSSLAMMSYRSPTAEPNLLGGRGRCCRRPACYSSEIGFETRVHGYFGVHVHVQEARAVEYRLNAMFLPIKSFGSTIGLPFLSANEDNQLRFRTGATGVKRLASGQVSTLCAAYDSMFDQTL